MIFDYSVTDTTNDLLPSFFERILFPGRKLRIINIPARSHPEQIDNKMN